MTVVDLPENYVAFVLPSATQAPSDSDLESLRLVTIDYLQQRLQTEFFPSLTRLDIQLISSEFDTKKPAERFNLYLKAHATAYFNESSIVPERSEVFEKYVSSFTDEYLEKPIRKLDAPSLVDALEVRARRTGPGTPAGAVTAPRFFMSFICEEEPTSPPSQTEKDTVLKIAHTEFTKLMIKEFEDEFEKISLKIVKTEIGPAAGKPNPKFNLYIEFEAVANFKQNVPEPMDFFRAISDPPIGLNRDIKAIDGTFATGKEMVVRCVFVETPDLPDMPEAPEEEEEDGSEGEGEEGEKKQKQKQALVVKIELGFYVALVIRELKAMPNINQIDSFDQMAQKFFTGEMKRNFPKFVDLKLEPSPQFQAGIPLPRFNMVHEYDAVLQFQHPPPDGQEVLKKILYCDLSKLYNDITGLPEPYDEMAEFTLGRALEKEITDQAYGGTLSPEQQQKEADERDRKEAAKKAAEEEKKRQEEAAKQAAEEKKRQEEAAKRAAEEQRKQEEEARKQAAEEKKRQEEAAERAAEEKRKQEEEARRRAEEEAKRAAEEKRRQEEADRREAEEQRRQEEADRQEAEEQKRQDEARREADEKQRQEDAAKALAEKKRREEEEARREAEERARKEKERKDAEARAKAAKEAKEREEAERKRNEEAAKREEAERKAKEEAKRAEEEKRKREAEAEAKAKQAAKKKGEEPTAAPQEPTIPVGTADVYVAFTLPNCKSEPKKSQYDKLAAATEKYYAKYLKKKYDTFSHVEVTLGKAYFKENKPNDKYDVYIEWVIKADFAESGGEVPDRYQLCTALVNIDLMAYLTKHVRKVKGTAFEGACGIFTQQRNKN